MRGPCPYNTINRRHTRHLSGSSLACCIVVHPRFKPERSYAAFRTASRKVPRKHGQYALSHDGHLLILFHWIEGRTVGFERFSDEVLIQAATAVGTLHKSASQIEWPNPPRETFDLPFEEALRKNLDVLPGITTADTPGKQGLRRLLLPRKQEIVHLLTRLKELQAQMQATYKAMVICHTDLHGGNMILDDQGTLHLLDWEGACLAPPEHDLFFFAWDERLEDLFMPHYERAFRPIELDGDTLSFYCYRRNLEDLAEWVVRILYENRGEQQDQKDLAGIVEDCISDWPYLA